MRGQKGDIAIAPMLDEKLEKRIRTLNLESKMPSRTEEHSRKADFIESKLREFIPQDRITRDSQVLTRHGRDLTWHAFNPPDLVVYPHNVHEISRILKLCNEQNFPVISFGKGSSLEGNILAPLGGLSLDMRQMNHIKTVFPDDGVCVVEPGVTRGQLNSAIHESGYFFGCDPGADATLGGMAATGAAGPTALGYGTMQSVVLGLQVVLADGRVIHTGTNVRKTRAGYNLTSLFVGSEGTLGVITELTLLLSPLPKVVHAARCVFPKGEILKAVKTVEAIIKQHVPTLVRCELLDEWSVDAVNRDTGRSYPIAPTLFLEFHSDDQEYLNRQVNKVSQIARTYGGTHWKSSSLDSPEDTPEKIWSARYDAWYAIPKLKEGAEAFATDVAVPISQLGKCIEAAQSIAKEEKIGMLPIIGHVGAGNFHTFVLVDMKKPDEVVRAKRFNARLMRVAQEMKGTCTGEHGIGMGKKEELIREVGKECVELQCGIKRTFDAKGILNPRKIFKKKMVEEERVKSVPFSK